MALACGRHGGGSSWSRALPNGTYDLSGPTCASTGKTPDYPAGSYRVALFDFDALTERSLTLDGMHVTEVFRAEDCVMTVQHGVFQNYDGVYSARHDRRFSFDPMGCTLAATAAGTTLRVGPEYSDLVKDSEDRAEELPFDVESTGDRTYLLTSRDLEELNQLWGTYGCAKPDRLKMQAVARDATN